MLIIDQLPRTLRANIERECRRLSPDMTPALVADCLEVITAEIADEVEAVNVICARSATTTAQIAVESYRDAHLDVLFTPQHDEALVHLAMATTEAVESVEVRDPQDRLRARLRAIEWMYWANIYAGTPVTDMIVDSDIEEALMTLPKSVDRATDMVCDNKLSARRGCRTLDNAQANKYAREGLRNMQARSSNGLGGVCFTHWHTWSVVNQETRHTRSH